MNAAIPPPPRASCIYEGRIRHRRFHPVEHAFEYSLYMLYLDLDELPGVLGRGWFWSAERPAPVRFCRKDYLGDPLKPLGEEVRRIVGEATGRRPGGPIRLLTQIRHFGFVFNPLSVYLCFDPTGRDVETVLAEVSNTPWNERHIYILTPEMDRGSRGRHAWRFAKEFHVSPFMDMAMRYEWRMNTPGRTLAIHMENHAEGRRVFDAALTMRRREISGLGMARCLLRHPFITARIVAGIYGQAMRLWRKGAPFFPHPSRSTTTKEAGSS